MKLLKHSLSSHTASVVCLSAIISLKHFSPFCVHLQTEQQSIAFIWQPGNWDGSSSNLYFARLRCTNKLSQYYWSISEENSPPIICYRTTHTIQDRAWQMERWVEHYSELYAIQKEYGVWRSPERYKVLTSNGGARLRTLGAERGSGFACTWKSTQEGHYPIWDPEMLKWRCLYRALFAT